MFIAFNFGNFRSFRDLQQLSLEAMPLRTNDDGLSENNVFNSSGLRLVKTKAIFGGNASGKSNLVKAIAAFHNLVSRSVAQESIPEQIWNERFQLITEWDSQPIFFQHVFVLDKSIYRYGFQIVNGIISYEWLYSGYKNKEIEYFMRSPEGLVVNEEFFAADDRFIRQDGEVENELFRKDSLYLTAAALNGNKLLGKLRGKIRTIMLVDGVYDASAAQYAMTHFIDGPKAKKEALVKLLAAADTGIEELEISEMPDHLIDHNLKNSLGERSDKKIVSLFSSHPVFDWDGVRMDNKAVPFGEWESEGTGKLLGIGALVLDALGDGRTIIIDEFDARFHPNLTLKIVQLFHDSKTNPKNAQLLFVTHDSGLLRRAELRRDQIWFVNKDRYGISTGVNLIEFKGVRKDASYEKEYLNGTYSGIPYLDKIDNVVISANQHD
jgi:AAA15 family ATPase/GTPase